MSVIMFVCTSDKREYIKENVFKLLHSHYIGSVFPNTRVQYKNEGEDVYAGRLKELMENYLCRFEDTDEGIKVEFDSTEDAGFSIADVVYRTGMGYSDEGLTFLKPFFDELIKTLPGIPFEADCECFDKWVSDEYHCSYDGKTFECDAEWFEFE